jgi:hypothetical protein
VNVVVGLNSDVAWTSIVVKSHTGIMCLASNMMLLHNFTQLHAGGMAVYILFLER